MRRMRLASRILRTLLKDRMYHPDRLIADTFGIIARCGVLLVLYWYVFQIKGGEVNGVGFDVVAWSMFFYFSFSILRLRDISKAIMEDIQSGTVEILFSKPISYLGYRMWWQIGAGLYPFLVATILGSGILLFTVGITETMKVFTFIPSLLLAFLGAVILSLVLYTILGLLAFWIEEVTPLFWIVDKSVMILGGSYLPVAFFPSFMYKLAILSPFGASQFITHSVYESWQSNWYMLLGIQLFWIVALSIVMVLMFTRAKQRVSINGG